MSQFEINPAIKLHTIGKIIEGTRHIGFYIKVIQDPKIGKGYYIYQSTSKKFDSKETYDAWVEDIESLNLFFTQTKWKIDWFPDLKSV